MQLKRRSSFFYLNITQTFLVMNDNIYRLLITFMLIDHWGRNRSHEVIAVAALIFILPFIFFMIPAGSLADKYSKRNVIVWCKIAETIIIVFSLFAFYFQWDMISLIILGLLATVGAVFTPSKFSIIPEIVPEDKLTKANSQIVFSTYFAIVVGTLLASFLTDITDRDYFLVGLITLCMSVFSLWTSFKIEITPASNPQKRIKFFFLREIYRSLKDARKYDGLFNALMGAPLFLFAAAYAQLNIIPFGFQVLDISDTDSGYLFLTSAIGVGIGSILVGLLVTKTIELGLVPFGGIVAGIGLYLMGSWAETITMSVFFLMILGVAGAMYTIPLDAFIQHASPKERRGEMMAAATFLGFIGVFCAAVCLRLFGDLMGSPAEGGFMYVGIIAVIYAFLLACSIPEHVLRFVVLECGRIRYVIKQPDQEFSNRQCIYRISQFNFPSWIFVINNVPRVVFCVPCISGYARPFSRFFRWFGVILYFKNQGREQVMQRLTKICEKGYSICIFGDDDFSELGLLRIAVDVQKQKHGRRCELQARMKVINI